MSRKDLVSWQRSESMSSVYIDDSLVQSVNGAIDYKGSHLTLGLLDIYGFEVGSRDGVSHPDLVLA